jgi:hypothetical protein
VEYTYNNFRSLLCYVLFGPLRVYVSWHSKLALQGVEEGSNYLQHRSASRKRRREGNSVPGGITGPPCPWGIEIRGPDPPGCWSLECETIKCAHESCCYPLLPMRSLNGPESMSGLKPDLTWAEPKRIELSGEELVSSLLEWGELRVENWEWKKKENTIMKIRNEKERDRRAATEDRKSLMLTSPVPNRMLVSLSCALRHDSSKNFPLLEMYCGPAFLVQKSLKTASLSQSDTHS